MLASPDRPISLTDLDSRVDGKPRTFLVLTISMASLIAATSTVLRFSPASRPTSL